MTRDESPLSSDWTRDSELEDQEVRRFELGNGMAIPPHTRDL